MSASIGRRALAEGIGTAVHLYFPRIDDTAAAEKKPAEAAE